MIEQLLSPRLVMPGEAAVYDQLRDEKVHILLSKQDTGGALALFIDEVPPNGGPPLHIHHQEDETFYLLEGELVMQVNGEQVTVGAGSVAFLPRGVPHTFTNPGTETARALVILTPGGLEGFFAEVEPLVTQAEPEMGAVLAVAAKYGIEAIGPPLAG
jgi:mannose-6-phosphate isomerase-like protein (cupin superfamily)